MTWEQPVEVEIHVKGPGGEVTIKHRQGMDKVGRFTEPADGPMKRANADAASWLRRRGKEPRR